MDRQIKLCDDGIDYCFHVWVYGWMGDDDDTVTCDALSDEIH